MESTKWITRLEPGSSWVHAFGLVEFNKEILLAVQFKDQVASDQACVYSDTGWEDFARMKAAGSKGKWLWGNATTRGRSKKENQQRKRSGRETVLRGRPTTPTNSLVAKGERSAANYTVVAVTGMA